MWSSLVEYHRPKNMEQALSLLSREAPPTAVLGGGTWLVARRDPSICAVVDLSGLDLAFVRKKRQAGTAGGYDNASNVGRASVRQRNLGRLIGRGFATMRTPFHPECRHAGGNPGHWGVYIRSAAGVAGAGCPSGHPCPAQA